MPAARGVKRAASKSSASTASTAPKNKKKRAAPVHHEIPKAPNKRGRVFTCGQGDVGQLGLGEDVIELTKFKQVPGLGDKIVAVRAGGMHTIAIDSSGKVWTYGCNDEGALGRTTAGSKDECTPKKVTLPGKAVAISAGDSHSAALLENGDVYAWGSFRDSHGSMGLVVRGREGKPCRAPVHVEVGEPAVGIASGGDHLVVISTSGGVYTMGCGEQGQLGRLSQRSSSRDSRQGFSALLVPGRVTLKHGASAVWAGHHATFVLDGNQEKVFAFGLNNYGQLGITGDGRKTALYTPLECDAFTSRGVAWRCVAPGQHHSLVLDGAGQVYAMGRCEYGRLGLGEGTGDANHLEPVPKLQGKKCVSIAAGTCNSFAVTDTGEVYGWGMGSEGQLGTGACSDAAEPVPAVCVALQEHRPSSVAAGGQHTVLLVEDPNPNKEPSPEPESETAEEMTEASNEEEEKVEKVEKSAPRSKRQKKTEQEEEVSSSSAQPSKLTEETKPQKLNGDENKEKAMEVDETDNKEVQDTKDEKSNPEKEQKMDTDQADEQTKPEILDTSSQGTTDSETKSQDSQESEKSQDSESQDDKSQGKSKDDNSQESVKDVEMTEKLDVNGMDESEKVEIKTVDAIQTPLTTTA